MKTEPGTPPARRQRSCCGVAGPALLAGACCSVLGLFETWSREWRPHKARLSRGPSLGWLLRTLRLRFPVEISRSRSWALRADWPGLLEYVAARPEGLRARQQPSALPSVAEAPAGSRVRPVAPEAPSHSAANHLGATACTPQCGRCRGALLSLVRTACARASRCRSCRFSPLERGNLLLNKVQLRLQESVLW